MQILMSTDTHPGADWIYKQARKQIPAISLGTVYRNLGMLVSLNQIRALNHGGSIRYDANMTDHLHFTCTRCGNIYDISMNLEHIIAESNQLTEHQIRNFTIRFSGECAACKSINQS